jgi:hypothetical protein
MNVNLGLLAEEANISTDGKLNLLGVFDQILTKNIPVTIPKISVVLKIDCHSAEYGVEKRIRIVLVGPDGKETMETLVKATIDKANPEPIAVFGHIVECDGVELYVEGEYRFSILIDDDLKREIRFKLEVTDAMLEDERLAND